MAFWEENTYGHQYFGNSLPDNLVSTGKDPCVSALPFQSTAIAPGVCPSCLAVSGYPVLGVFTFQAVSDAWGIEQLLYCGVV